VPYETKDVGTDYAAAIEMIQRSGQQGVPVVATEDEVILGFDQVRLAKLAEKYAGPKRPPLGVLAADAEESLARHPEKAESIPPGTKGVFVGKIRPETVAERAGLRAGDVIVGLAGKRVRSMGQLDQLVGTLKAGDAVPVRYLRDGAEATATLQF
jgi:S1-C subfamily serine protease